MAKYSKKIVEDIDGTLILFFWQDRKGLYTKPMLDSWENKTEYGRVIIQVENKKLAAKRIERIKNIADAKVPNF